MPSLTYCHNAHFDKSNRNFDSYCRSRIVVKLKPSRSQIAIVKIAALVLAKHISYQLMDVVS